jgi:hypothetical protein
MVASKKEESNDPKQNKCVTKMHPCMNVQDNDCEHAVCPDCWNNQILAEASSSPRGGRSRQRESERQNAENCSHRIAKKQKK